MWHSARGAASFQGFALMMIQRVQNLITADKNSQFLFIIQQTFLQSPSATRFSPGSFPLLPGSSVPGGPLEATEV